MLKISIEAKSYKEMAKKLHIAPRRMEELIQIRLDRLGTEAAKIMRRPLSGRMPYGTGRPGEPPVVARSFRLPNAIDYKIEASASTGRGHMSRKLLTVGVLGGTPEVRQIIAVHEFGKTIRTGLGRQIVFSPFKSKVSRDPSTGAQNKTLAEAVADSDSWFLSPKPLSPFYRKKRKKEAPPDPMDKYKSKLKLGTRWAYFRSSPEAEPELGFVFTSKVTIPERRVISSSANRVNNLAKRRMEDILLSIKRSIEHPGDSFFSGPSWWRGESGNPINFDSGPARAMPSDGFRALFR